MNIKQGQIWWVTNPNASGSELQKSRPGLVLQNDLANRYLRTTIVAMISSSGKDNMAEMVPVGTEESLHKGSHVDFAHIFTVDQSRLSKQIGKISSAKWTFVEKALGSIFLKTLSS